MELYYYDNDRIIEADSSVSLRTVQYSNRRGGVTNNHSPTNFGCEACVKKQKHIYNHQSGHPGGINGVSDNDDFDVWTSLGSFNEFQSWNSISEGVKKSYTVTRMFFVPS